MCFGSLCYWDAVEDVRLHFHHLHLHLFRNSIAQSDIKKYAITTYQHYWRAYSFYRAQTSLFDVLYYQLLVGALLLVLALPSARPTLQRKWPLFQFNVLSFDSK